MPARADADSPRRAERSREPAARTRACRCVKGSEGGAGGGRIRFGRRALAANHAPQPLAEVASAGSVGRLAANLADGRFVPGEERLQIAGGGYAHDAIGFTSLHHHHERGRAGHAKSSGDLGVLLHVDGLHRHARSFQLAEHRLHSAAGGTVGLREVEEHGFTAAASTQGTGDHQQLQRDHSLSLRGCGKAAQCTARVALPCACRGPRFILNCVAFPPCPRREQCRAFLHFLQGQFSCAGAQNAGDCGLRLIFSDRVKRSWRNMPIVGFRSAKARTFAERKATMG